MLISTSCRFTAAFRLLRGIERLERRRKELRGYALRGIGLRGNAARGNGARPIIIVVQQAVSRQYSNKELRMQKGQFWGTWRARGARAYNGGLGAEPPAGSRSRAPGQGARGNKAPLKLKAF